VTRADITRCFTDETVSPATLGQFRAMFAEFERRLSKQELALATFLKTNGQRPISTPDDLMVALRGDQVARR